VRNFLIILQKELRAFFVSPLAYVIMALVMIMNGLSFRLSLESMVGKVSQQGLLYLTFNSFWFWMVFFLVFPLITMRLFAEEKKMGTMETLLTAPVSIISVVMAKFTATLIFYCVLWIPSMFNFMIFEAVTDSPAAYTPGAFFGTYLILFLIGLLNISLGCFASSLTNNQVIAGVLAFCFVVMHFFMGFLHIFSTKMSQEVMDRVYYFSSFEHLKLFSQGLVDTRPVIYYVSLAGLFLTFTYYVIESRRWHG